MLKINFIFRQCKCMFLFICFSMFYKCLSKAMYYFVIKEQIITIKEVFSEISSYIELYE